MTIAGYVPYFTIYSNVGTISLASEGIISIPAPVIPPIEPPVEPPPGMMVGTPAGAGRGRMIRRRERKREDEDLAPPAPGPQPPDLQPPALGPPPPDLPPPPPGLMAGIPIPIAQLPRNAPLDEDEEEIALLLELLS